MIAMNLVQTIVDGFARSRFLANSTEDLPPQEGNRRPAPSFMFSRNGVLGGWSQSLFIASLLLAHTGVEDARAQGPIARLEDLLAVETEDRTQPHFDG